MNTTYFIDNESIKRTAKAIQKNNPTFKYTLILDELAKLLGYSSYNQYEHYLTNLFLSKDSNLKSLTPLTKIDALSLCLLQASFKQELLLKGIHVDNLYFIEKVINNQKEAFVTHQAINLYSYLYYLPFIFNYTDLMDSSKQKIDERDLSELVNQVKVTYQSIDRVIIQNLIKELHESSDKESANWHQFQSLKYDLKTRGIYYYIKSEIEDIAYDEGLLTQLIFRDYSTERIVHELALRLINTTFEDRVIPVFYKKDIASFNQNYFPFIKNNVTEKHPILLGRNLDNSPYFANMEHLRSNIALLGIPGSGKTTFIYPLLYQMLMNNRGFCLFSVGDFKRGEFFVNHMVQSLNKEEDLLYVKHNDSLKNVASAIHNEKVLVINCAEENDWRRNIDVGQKFYDRFDLMLESITQYFFNSKFREKKVPYYIFVEEFDGFHVDLTPNTIEKIEQLNKLNIFLIFSSQLCEENKMNSICDTVLITNCSLHTIGTRARSNRICQDFWMDKRGRDNSLLEVAWMDKIERDNSLSEVANQLANSENILGKDGPSLDNPPVFSLIYKHHFVDQFVTEVDYDFLNAIEKKT